MPTVNQHSRYFPALHRAPIKDIIPVARAWYHTDGKSDWHIKINYVPSNA